MTAPRVDRLPDEDWLSQYGTTVEFRDTPKEGQAGISLCWGWHSVTAMVLAVTFRPFRRSRERARHTTVRRLREAGFVVTHSPTQRNLFHVTVSYPGNWDAAVAARFRERFDAPIGE